MNQDQSQARPRLTDGLSGEALRTFQEGIAGITRVPTIICDHRGRPVIRPCRPGEAIALLMSSGSGRQRLQQLLEQLTHDAASVDHPVLKFQAAPIAYDNLQLGAVLYGGLPHRMPTAQALDDLVDEFGLDPDARAPLKNALTPWPDHLRKNAIPVVQLLADIIGQLTVQSANLQHREIEIGTVHAVGSMLATTQDLQVILDTIASKVCEATRVKAASIRLLDEQTNELVIKAAHNLSVDYRSKGPIILEDNPIDRHAFSGEAVYVEDMTTDPRVRLADQARLEGIVSCLCVGMTYRGQTIGVMRIYTDRTHHFSTTETALLRWMASQSAAAIINSRLYLDALQAQNYERQLNYAGDIQRRMIPKHPPEHPKIELACLYEPSFEVGGDFFDFYMFPDSDELGLCIADVAGKGIPAALMMASLRTAFRLYATSVIEITEAMAMINMHMNRETLISEFATMYYGVFSGNGRALTFCSAGHDPPLHCRGQKVTSLTTNDFVIGVDPAVSYSKKRLALKQGDVLLFYTDGIVDARDFSGQAFGRHRLQESLQRHCGTSASQIANNIIWDVRRFVGLADQADDMTMVVARIR